MSKYKIGPIRGHLKPRTYSVTVHDTEDQDEFEEAARIEAWPSVNIWLRVVGMERVEELRRQGFFPPRRPARESW